MRKCDTYFTLNMESESKLGQVLGESSNTNEVFKPPILIKHLTDEASKEFLDQNLALQAFAYKAPEWAKTPKNGHFYIDVIKNGVILETIKLDSLKNDSFIVFGRFPPVDIQLDHPSVSRQHLVLQYGNLIPKRPAWYLYDMNSTHGTRLNKNSVQKNHYVPIDIGYVFQIAGSSRVFSFCGPESEILKDETIKSLNTSSKWSLAIDEDDDKEDDEKRYFEKDPVAWLEKYFEREGLPFNFDYTTEGKGSEIVCSIELSDEVNLDGGSLISATAPNRKLAQFQCALTACERLEEKNLLRVFSIWNKRKTYVDNDYYDSDEDIFFDRTGQIEEQRKKRKLRCEGGEGITEKSKNFAELSENLIETENKVKIVQTELCRILGKDNYLDADGKVNTNLNFSTRMAISQMRSKEKKYIAECEQLRKIIEMVRPRNLDSLFPPIEKKFYLENTFSDAKLVKNNEEINNKIKASLKKEIIDEEKNEHNLDLNDNAESFKKSNETSANNSIIPLSTSTSKIFNIKKERNYEPAAMPPIDLPKFGLLQKSEALIYKNPLKIKQKRQQQKMDDDLMGSDYSNISNEVNGEYTTWLPPNDQSGDGQTKLNKKFEGRY